MFAAVPVPNRTTFSSIDVSSAATALGMDRVHEGVVRSRVTPSGETTSSIA